ncbi:hypothetical protein MKK68_20000 [Methylobacterium sp. E-016]|uniref:hypothetical protein n=1 Tax=Methylobacterium sp. E-016 TaxID=2836556 RepID=UPI001FBB20F7|nr:hypothetical protein [Methylobacterium sp. E-016]MCJ2077898.1 hypothetical protein [Methylobacterium sp. E-016]
MTDQEPKAKRAPKPKIENKRGSLTIRLRDEVRRDLEASALKYGRSLSEEMETRMEISLAQKAQYKYEWGEDYYDIAVKTAAALSYIEDTYGCRWHESEAATQVFEQTAAKIIQNARDHFARIERDRLSGAATNLVELPVEDQAKWFAGLGGSNPPYKRRKSVEVVGDDD